MYKNKPYNPEVEEIREKIATNRVEMQKAALENDPETYFTIESENRFLSDRLQVLIDQEPDAKRETEAKAMKTYQARITSNDKKFKAVQTKYNKAMLLLLDTLREYADLCNDTNKAKNEVLTVIGWNNAGEIPKAEKLPYNDIYKIVSVMKSQEIITRGEAENLKMIFNGCYIENPKAFKPFYDPVR